MNRLKWIVLVGLGILLALLGVWAILARLAPWYFLGSTEMSRTHQRLLESLPTPPGRVIETDYTNADPIAPFSIRAFDVNGNYQEVVDFFKVEIPLLDWQLLKEKENTFDLRHNDYVQSISLLFSHQKYCLEIGIGTSVDKQGIQEGNRVWVRMRLTEGIGCDFW